MKYGLTLPIFDEMAHPAVLAELATEAEDAGWDGIFVWDHVYYREPATRATDPWIALAAMAAATHTLTLGPMVTPLARRRPQVVARQIVALDHLSEGRMVIGVGLGLDSSGGEFVRFGEETDVAARAARYDEALGLLRALLAGEQVDHDGPHYRVADSRFLPGPCRGRLPVWTAARWPNRRPLACGGQRRRVRGGPPAGGSAGRACLHRRAAPRGSRRVRGGGPIPGRQRPAPVGRGWSELLARCVRSLHRDAVGRSACHPAAADGMRLIAQRGTLFLEDRFPQG